MPLHARSSQPAAPEQAGMRPFNFALADFMKPPQVRSIDAAGYHGDIGDPIVINIEKEFELTGVSVKLLTPANAVVEEGAAALFNGRWRYSATTVAAPGTSLIVQVVARDFPGHTGERQFLIVVA